MLQEFKRPTRWKRARDVTPFEVVGEVISGVLVALAYAALQFRNPGFDKWDWAFTVLAGLIGALVFWVLCFIRNFVKAPRSISEDEAKHYFREAVIANNKLAEAEAKLKADLDPWAGLPVRIDVDGCFAYIVESPGFSDIFQFQAILRFVNHDGAERTVVAGEATVDLVREIGGGQEEIRSFGSPYLGIEYHGLRRGGHDSIPVPRQSNSTELKLEIFDTVLETSTIEPRHYEAYINVEVLGQRKTPIKLSVTRRTNHDTFLPPDVSDD